MESSEEFDLEPLVLESTEFDLEFGPDSFDLKSTESDLEFGPDSFDLETAEFDRELTLEIDSTEFKLESLKSTELGR